MVLGFNDYDGAFGLEIIARDLAATFLERVAEACPERCILALGNEGLVAVGYIVGFLILGEGVSRLCSLVASIIGRPSPFQRAGSRHCAFSLVALVSTRDELAFSEPSGPYVGNLNGDQINVAYLAATHACHGVGIRDLMVSWAGAGGANEKRKMRTAARQALSIHP